MGDIYNGFRAHHTIGFGESYEGAARGKDIPTTQSTAVFPEDEDFETVYCSPPVKGIPSKLGLK